MYGNPADLVRLRDVCDRHGLWLVEDLSHATGATVAGRPVGSFGHMAFFSMQASKLVSGGEGGVLLTDDTDLYARALALGHDKRRGQLPQAYVRDQLSCGFKFRLSSIHALLGLESFRRFHAQNTIRSEMFRELHRRIEDLDSVKLPRQPRLSERVWWEYELLLSDDLPPPGEIARRLLQQGVIAGPAKFEFLPELPAFRQDQRGAGEYPHARRHRSRLLLLSPFKKRGYEVLDEYTAVLRAALRGSGD
jgi:dTDP-4-amino-4,6-dideoxygalactose transaminase